VTVQFTTSNGTATAGSDYVATNGTLSFTAAGTNQVTVLVNGDTTGELDKTLFLVLSNPTNAAIQSGTVVQGEIVDDDLFPLPPAASAIPTNDLVLWLRPGVLEALTNGQDVASWRDSTIPREDTRNSGSSPPALQTNILNGYSAVRFDVSSSQYLTNNAPTTFVEGTEFSAFAVVGNVGGGPHQTIFGGPPVAGFGTIYGRANGSFRIQSETATDASGHSDMTAAFQFRSFARDTGNTVSATLDGTLDDTPSVVLGTFDLHAVGARLSTGAPLYLDGDIVEVLIYSSELSADDRQLVEGSLAWKYGLEGNLPGGHPHKNVDPNFTSLSGSVITFQ